MEKKEWAPHVLTRRRRIPRKMRGATRERKRRERMRILWRWRKSFIMKVWETSAFGRFRSQSGLNTLNWIIWTLFFLVYPFLLCVSSAAETTMYRFGGVSNTRWRPVCLYFCLVSYLSRCRYNCDTTHARHANEYK